ncbi:MAG: hypothetical protein HN904_15585, partial [Victivallales bacterium]|nr:hypothetical protein [Victivallales bacterium]
KKAAQALPVPERFRDIDPARIRQYLPRRHSKRLPPFIKAPDAELGYAAIVDKPDMPFHFGFHQGDNAPRAVSALSTLPEGTKAKWVRTGNSGFGLRRELATAEIVPGKYHIYRLAEIEVTPNCQIWFSSSSWQTRLQVGSRLYELGANNRWEAYVSMKFDGPTYGGTGADTVLCDRVILLRRDARDTRPGTSKPAHPQEQQ